MKKEEKRKFYLILFVCLMFFTNCTVQSNAPEVDNNEVIVNNIERTPESEPSSISETTTSSAPETLPISTSYASSQDFEQSGTSAPFPDAPLQSSQIVLQNDFLPESFQNIFESIKNKWGLMVFDDYVAVVIGNYREDLRSLEPVISELPEGAKPIRPFQIAVTVEDTADVTRYMYTFYENGIEEVTDRPSLGFSKSTYYDVEKASYNAFLNVLDEVWYTNEFWYPLWPMYAVAQNIEQITYTSVDGEHSLSYSKPSDTRLTHWEEVQYLEPVNYGSAVTVKKDTVIENAACITVQYSTGAVFEIWQNVNQTLVTASNMDYAVLYDADVNRTQEGFLFFINQLSQNKAIPENT